MSTARHNPPRYTRRQLAHRGGIERHDHDRHQLLYPTRGVITVTADVGTWVIPPLRAVWLPAHCPHAHTAHGAVELSSVLFPAETSPLEPGRPTLLTVSPLLREALLALTAAAPLTADKRQRLEAVVIDLLEPVSAAQSRHHLLPEPADDRLRAVAGILRADPADPRTLAELGRAVGSSDRTLSRLFRADTGMSFPQWRAQLRLQAALIDLSTGTPVGAVAHRYGYSTPSAFIVSFRRAFGSTPGAYVRR